MLEAFLLDDVRLGSEDPTGELLCPLEILRTAAPGLASLVCAREGSDSLPIMAASRLLDIAARLDEPLDRPKKWELNCIGQAYCSSG